MPLQTIEIVFINLSNFCSCYVPFPVRTAQLFNSWKLWRVGPLESISRKKLNGVILCLKYNTKHMRSNLWNNTFIELSNSCRKPLTIMWWDLVRFIVLLIIWLRSTRTFSAIWMAIINYNSSSRPFIICILMASIKMYSRNLKDHQNINCKCDPFTYCWINYNWLM